MSHSNNLSIHSVQSIIEPTTPPSLLKKSSSNTTNGHNISYHLQVNNDITNTPEINSKFWESTNYKNANINNTNPKLINCLPNLFEKISLDKENTPDFLKPKGHIATPNVNNNVPVMSSNCGSTTSTHIAPNGKVNKEYLASINKAPLLSLKPEILRLAKDQYGCRFLQKKIDENVVPNYQVRFANFEIIFQEIYPHLYELIIDPFGNYLIQKLIVYCGHASLNLMLEILQFNLFQISINQHGTRAFQKIIEHLTNNYQLNLLIKGLKPYVIELIKDLNGNHVVQKILNKYPPKDCQFIYDSIIDDLFVVATHKHGCCVLQKCLNHVTVSQLDQFSAIILKFDNFETLINDQFGNYVLQYLISINSWDINNKIFENFLKFGLNNLCNLKFSSNVIEKFLKNCYTNELVDPKFINLKFGLVYYILRNDLSKLINDPYGNYVIQTMIDILINPQVNYLQEGVVNDKLLKLVPEGFPLGGLSNTSLQIVIIKSWFVNCKIVSSFGKRIQSKINIILNSHTMPNASMMNAGPIYGNQSNHVFHQRKQASLSSASCTPTTIQNMNSNGEFIFQDQRSAGFAIAPINNETRANSVPHIFNQYDTSSSTNLAQQRLNDFIINEHPFGYNNSGNGFDYNIRLSPPNQVDFNRLGTSQLHQNQHQHQFSINSDMSVKSHRSQSSSGSLPGFSSGNHYVATNEGFVNGNMVMNSRNVNGVSAPLQGQINPNQYNGQYMNSPPFQGNQHATAIGTMGPLNSTGEPTPLGNIQTRKPMDPVYYY